MNGPGEEDTDFYEALQDSKFHDPMLTQTNAQNFSVLCTESTTDRTQSIRNRFPVEHVSLITDINSVLNASRYPSADRAMKSYGVDALERVCAYYSTQRGEAAPLGQKEHRQQDFLPVKRVLAGSGRTSFRESCKLLITSLGEMFLDYKTLAEVVLVIPILCDSSVSASKIKLNLSQEVAFLRQRLKI